KTSRCVHIGDRSRAEALKASWYSMRWKIETVHNVLKSGCGAEASKLWATRRIAKLNAPLCILSWRTFWPTMMNRVAPTVPPTLVLTGLEARVLDSLAPDLPGEHACRGHLFPKA